MVDSTEPDTPGLRPRAPHQWARDPCAAPSKSKQLHTVRCTGHHSLRGSGGPELQHRCVEVVGGDGKHQLLEGLHHLRSSLDHLVQGRHVRRHRLLQVRARIGAHEVLERGDRVAQPLAEEVAHGAVVRGGHVGAVESAHARELVQRALVVAVRHLQQPPVEVYHHLLREVGRVCRDQRLHLLEGRLRRLDVTHLDVYPTEQGEQLGLRRWPPPRDDRRPRRADGGHQRRGVLLHALLAKRRAKLVHLVQQLLKVSDRDWQVAHRAEDVDQSEDRLLPLDVEQAHALRVRGFSQLCLRPREQLVQSRERSVVVAAIRRQERLQE
mmetsp:Transcript_37124/g.85212  ORF Transcript_37124/g.85212 Transcript_37124/m.85212 type:complete len:324 (-) Transcript_37124:500-1471(-)